MKIKNKLESLSEWQSYAIKLESRNSILMGHLQHISRYKKKEVCYDEFAYKRMLKALKKCARNALKAVGEKPLYR